VTIAKDVAIVVTKAMNMSIIAEITTVLAAIIITNTKIKQLFMRNSFGNLFTLTTFGESHGEAVGGIVDGMPSGVDIDLDFIQNELNRRRPGQSRLTTARQEADKIELLSGVFEGKSTGCPIGFIIKNTDQHSKDYENMRNLFRPSHADYTYFKKFGIRDYRGGGRSSARITISRCVGGALAKLALKPLGITVQAYTSQIGDISLKNDYRLYDLTKTESNDVRCPDESIASRMADLIWKLKGEGDTTGGTVTCVIKGCPVGLGEPEFDKLNAQIGAAMLGINAVKGFEIGMGFNGVKYKGSEVNDEFVNENGIIRTKTNNSGGIQGGISNGEDIYFRVAFKPVATILQPQNTIDINGKTTVIDVHGRHDACVIPRAVPIVEAMAAMVILDNYMLMKSGK
jgi:chorismate synthase